MRRILLSGALSGALLVSLLGTASAASPKQTEPGAPGTPNCVGQTMAFLAQNGPDGVHGIGGLVHAFDASVKDLKAFVQLYCAGE
ncbi:MAG: hypothetical protein K1X87_11400 [Dehalococcoidia bacterium]|nr:hypothetical protein [Dehalococcoidia bacterium]HRC62325.1 hypothetical protein [Dehalococcoidia bacterium]